MVTPTERKASAGWAPDNYFYFYQGRVALYALLRALNVRKTDEVILPVFTCPSVIEPIRGLGARPVYCDIEQETYNLAHGEVKSRLSNKTRAIVVQHTFGIPANMDALMGIAARHGLHVIEDCCHVCGSRYKGVELGRIGEAAFYSYGAGKPVSIGCGGAAAVNSAALRAAVTSLYDQFEAPSLIQDLSINLGQLGKAILPRPVRRLLKFWLTAQPPGSDDPTAAVSSGDLGPEYRGRMHKLLRLRAVRIVTSVERRASGFRRVVTRLEEGLRELGISPVKVSEDSEAVLTRYPLRARDKAQLLREARKHRVELADWGTLPLRWLDSGDETKQGPECFPVARDAMRRLVILPLYPDLGAVEIRRTLRFLGEMSRSELL